ncbi:MAG: hypothetical protein ACRDUV_02335 [Pseudonocardiaceae bacterium]
MIKSTELAPRRSYQAGGRGARPVCADAGQPVSTGSPERPLTPGEALLRLFLNNADNGRNAANDEFIAALRQRARESGHSPTNAEIERGSHR